MKIIDKIKREQLEGLKVLGYDIKEFGVSYQGENNLTYFIDFFKENRLYHFVCNHNFERNISSYQLSFNDRFKSFTEEAFIDEFSKKVINYIQKQIF